MCKHREEALMRVRDVMTRDVVTASLDTPVSNAINLLADHGVAALPVIADDHLVGIISEADVLRHEVPREKGSADELLSDVGDMTYADLGAEAEASGEVVADVMTTPVVTVSESADTADVARLMLDYEVRSVPVVERDRVTGIVSRRDLIRTLVKDDRQMAEEIRRRLRDYSGEPDRWTVEVNGEAATIVGEFDDANERRVVELLAHTVLGVQTVRTVETNPQSSPDTERVGQSDTRAG
jgi:CBS domain-containing protein